MGWLDYHLWEFEAGDRRYGLPDPDWPDDSLFAAKNTKLKTQAFASSSIPVTLTTIGSTSLLSKPLRTGS